MSHRTIKYRKPGTKKWLYIVIKEEDADDMIRILKEEGYEVAEQTDN